MYINFIKFICHLINAYPEVTYICNTNKIRNKTIIGFMLKEVCTHNLAYLEQINMHKTNVCECLRLASCVPSPRSLQCDVSSPLSYPLKALGVSNFF